MINAIFSLEPIRNDILTMALLYVTYTVVAFTTGILTLYTLRQLGFDIRHRDFDLEVLLLRSPAVALITVFAIVVAEEVMFRGLPVFLISCFLSLDSLSLSGILILMIFHCTWSVLHLFNEEDKISSVPNTIFAFIIGFFFLRLWLGGLYYYAIAIHYIHNLAVISLAALHLRQD